MLQAIDTEAVNTPAQQGFKEINGEISPRVPTRFGHSNVPLPGCCLDLTDYREFISSVDINQLHNRSHTIVDGKSNPQLLRFGCFADYRRQIFMARFGRGDEITEEEQQRHLEQFGRRIETIKPQIAGWIRVNMQNGQEQGTLSVGPQDLYLSVDGYPLQMRIEEVDGRQCILQILQLDGEQIATRGLLPGNVDLISLRGELNDLLITAALIESQEGAKVMKNIIFYTYCNGTVDPIRVEDLEALAIM